VIYFFQQRIYITSGVFSRLSFLVLLHTLYRTTGWEADDKEEATRDRDRDGKNQGVVSAGQRSGPPNARTCPRKRRQTDQHGRSLPPRRANHALIAPQKPSLYSISILGNPDHCFGRRTENDI